MIRAKLFPLISFMRLFSLWYLSAINSRHVIFADLFATCHMPHASCAFTTNNFNTYFPFGDMCVHMFFPLAHSFFNGPCFFSLSLSSPIPSVELDAFVRAAVVLALLLLCIFYLIVITWKPFAYARCCCCCFCSKSCGDYSRTKTVFLWMARVLLQSVFRHSTYKTVELMNYKTSVSLHCVRFGPVPFSSVQFREILYNLTRTHTHTHKCACNPSVCCDCSVPRVKSIVNDHFSTITHYSIPSIQTQISEIIPPSPFKWEKC